MSPPNRIFRARQTPQQPRLVCSAVVLACTAALGRVALAQTGLAAVATIPMPAVEGRIDHLAIDSGAQRLYVAALGNNTVEVIDVKGGGRHLQSLKGFREPQGIAFVPAGGLV